MKTLESDYNEYGWKIKVKRAKDGTTQIFLRSKYKNHSFQKPFYLRLNEENLKILKKLLKEIEI